MVNPNIDTTNIVSSIDEGTNQSNLGNVTADIPVTWNILNNANVVIDNDGNLSLTNDADFDAIQNYTFQIQATDISDINSAATTGDINVPVNNVAPVINSSNLASIVDDGTNDLGSLSVEFGTAVWTKINGDAEIQINSETGDVTLSSPANYQDDPSYTFIVRATDSAGLTSEETFTVNVNDITPPILTTNIPNNISESVTTFGTVNSNEPVTWTLNDIDNTGVVIETVDSNNANINFPSGTNYQTAPTHRFSITGTDINNNISVTQEINVNVIDETSPILTSSFVTSIDDGLTDLGSISSSEPVTWTINGDSVEINTVNSTNATVNSTSSVNYQVKSSYTFTVTGTDSAGNPSTTESINIVVNDKTPPSLTPNFIDSIADGDTDLGSISANEQVTWSISGDGVEIITVDNTNAIVNLTSSANYQVKSSYNFTVSATDMGGNIATTQNIIVNVTDSTFPTLTPNIVDSINDGLYNLGTIVASETVTWSINDLDNTGILIDQNGNITLSNEANSHTASSHRFTVSGEDESNNITTTEEFNVPVNDITNPTVINITSSNNSGSYKAGDIITIQLEFNEPVDVIGTPYININVVTSGYPVYYSSGSGSNILEFEYTILNSHYTTLLDYVNSTSLYLDNGSIKDVAGNNLELSLAFPGDANSLSANKSIVIDTNNINIDEFLVSSNTLSKDEFIDISIKFSKSIPSLNNSNFVVDNGILSTISSIDSGFTWTATFTPFNNIIDYTNKITLEPTYTDLAGNIGPLVTSSIIQIDTTGTTYTSTRASVPKDATGSSGGSFSRSRLTFTRTVREQFNTLNEKQTKKFYGNSKDSTNVLSRKKNNAIGGGSLNPNKLMVNNFSNNKYNADSALRRLRS